MSYSGSAASKRLNVSRRICRVSSCNVNDVLMASILSKVHNPRHLVASLFRVHARILTAYSSCRLFLWRLD